MDIAYSLCANYGINRCFNIYPDSQVVKQGRKAFCCDCDHQHGRPDRKGQTGRCGQPLYLFCYTCFIDLAELLLAKVEAGCHLEYFAAAAGHRLSCKRAADNCLFLYYHLRLSSPEKEHLLLLLRGAFVGCLPVYFSCCRIFVLCFTVDELW